MNKMQKYMPLAVVLFLLVVQTASATGPDTTVFDGLESDALAYVGYGVGVFIGILGAGMGIVAGQWVYRKIKSAIRGA